MFETRLIITEWTKVVDLSSLTLNSSDSLALRITLINVMDSWNFDVVIN